MSTGRIQTYAFVYCLDHFLFNIIEEVRALEEKLEGLSVEHVTREAAFKELMRGLEEDKEQLRALVKGRSPQFTLPAPNFHALS